MDTNDKKLLAAFTAAVLLCVAGLWGFFDFIVTNSQKCRAKEVARTEKTSSRFTQIQETSGRFDLFTVTDTQTGKTYLVARTTSGVAITPLLP